MVTTPYRSKVLRRSESISAFRSPNNLIDLSRQSNQLPQFPTHEAALLTHTGPENYVHKQTRLFYRIGSLHQLRSSQYDLLYRSRDPSVKGRERMGVKNLDVDWGRDGSRHGAREHMRHDLAGGWLFAFRGCQPRPARAGLSDAHPNPAASCARVIARPLVAHVAATGGGTGFKVGGSTPHPPACTFRRCRPRAERTRPREPAA
jgi:hypothetical protein